MPPLAALLIACLLAIFALRAPLQTSALNNEFLVPPALTPIVPSESLPLPIADNTNLVVNNPPQSSNNLLFDFTIASSPSSSAISPVFTKEIQHWANDIVRWANESSIDPNLVAVIMQIESCGDPRAISRSGAMGLFQVMPFHFHITDNPFNPDTNALRGLNYLSRSLNTAGGNARLAMAGYNGGIGVISRGEGNWPSETQRYVRFGGPIYDDASSGVSSSPALQEWYERYGRGLCRQASNRLGITE
jgi:soluble lytic murein transglycosylase-like protein